MTLDELIKKKAKELYLNGPQKEKVKAKLNDLKTKLGELEYFPEMKHGGSYQRNTLVKGISDVDLYYRYDGNKSPQSVLEKTKFFLKKKYEQAEIKVSSPSIVIVFKKIKIEITPYILNKNGVELVPTKDLKNWNETNLFALKKKMKALRSTNNVINDVVKILKYWNFNNGNRFRSFEIENLIYNQFINQTDKPLHWYLLNFFKGNPQLSKYAKKFEGLIELEQMPNSPLRKSWNQFIDDK